MIVLDLVLAGAILWIYFHWPRRLVSLDQSKRPYWLSVTPGHPDCIPKLFIMKYGPWPQPKELNFGAFTPVRLAPDKPVILRGRPNKARYWGFVFYPADAKVHGSNLPGIFSPQMHINEDGTYEVVFSERKMGSNWVNTGKARAGIISMRNYLPARKRRIQMPAIYYGNELVLPPREYEYDF